jgi:hypothetical protein
MVTWENPLPSEKQKEWNSFSVKSDTGGLLKGLWSKTTRDHAVGAIVLGHPMGKEAKGYFLKNGYPELYRACGLHVIVFDFNGFGESSHGNFSFYEDIIAIGNFTSQTFPSLPIFYHGISLGGQWSTIAFTEDHPYDFALLESIPTTLEDFWVKFPTAHRVLKVLYFLMPKYARKVRMIDRIAELKRIKSLLLIYSETDIYTPVSMGQQFQQNCNVPTELWAVRDAEHAKIIKSQHKDEYQDKIKNFVYTSLNNHHSD